MSVASEVSPSRSQTASGAEPLRHSNTLWVSWSFHRRTAGLCEAWDIPLHLIRSRHKSPLRWFVLALETLRLLHDKKPEILFVQNPSLALTMLAVACRRVFTYFLVVDAHNEGVRPFDRPGKLVGWLTRRLLKSADLTIVTNAALAEDVVAAGGRPLVLPDRLPVPPAPRAQRVGTADAPEVAVIATYRPDEPISAILAAAAAMPECRFSFSGDSRKFRETGIQLPANVRLTGYLLDRDYWRLLAQADVICDLTLKTDCLVCGAYEGLAVGRPLVLSDNPPTREIFGAAAILTDSRPGEIAKALRAALEQRERLEANARSIRETYGANWRTKADVTWEAICAGARADSRGLT
jgi:glycosyltransferase involved in cell wall biosynthesis